MSNSTERRVFDVRTAPIEEISAVFGVSPIKARVMQLMERGEYDGDVQAVDAEGNPIKDITPAPMPLFDQADYIK